MSSTEPPESEKLMTIGTSPVAQSTLFLPPLALDACLRAMHLTSEKESFDRFNSFCQNWHNQVSQGSQLALALLYTRLYVAFCHRHRQNNTSSTNANQPKSTATQPRDQPSTVEHEQINRFVVVDLDTTDDDSNESQCEKHHGTKSTHVKEYDDYDDAEYDDNAASQGEQKTNQLDDDDTTDVGSVSKQAQSPFTNVELSPKVSSFLFRIVNDLLAVHSLLPQKMDSDDNNQNLRKENDDLASWTDWTVAQIGVLAHDFVLESTENSQLLNAWKIPLQHSSSSASVSDEEQIMYFIFCEKTAEWIAGRAVRVVEAYLDYLVIWKNIAVADDVEYDQEHAAEVQADDEKANHYQPTLKLNVLQLRWEPAVPEFSSPVQQGESKDAEIMKDDDEDNASITAPEGCINSAENVSDEVEMRARTVVWKIAVFYSLYIQQKQKQCIPSRRQRLLASVAALGLLFGLHRLGTARSEGDDESPRILSVLQTLANQQCAFMSWASLHPSKTDKLFSRDEIARATLALAKAVYALSKIWRPQSSQTQMERKDDSKDSSLNSLPRWLRHLNERVGKSPEILLWNLPSLATDLVDCFSRQIRLEKINVEASFFYDETSIVQPGHPMGALCKVSDRPMPLRQDTRTTAVAANLGNSRTGMAEQPYQVRKLLAASNKNFPNSRKRKLDTIGGSRVNNRNVPDCLKSSALAVITESMELTEWAVTLLSLEQVKPSAKLREFLGTADSSKDGRKQNWMKLMIPLLNSTLSTLSQEGFIGKTTRKAVVSVEAGERRDRVGTVIVTASGDFMHEKELGRALVAFYYHALESILAHGFKRSKKHVVDLVVSKNFHRSLLSCCLLCVLRALGSTQKLRPCPDLQASSLYQALLVCGSNPYEFLKVSEMFVRCVSALEEGRGTWLGDQDAKGTAQRLPPLPRILQRGFQHVENNVLESLLWSRDQTLGMSLPDLLEEFEERSMDGAFAWWPVQALQPSLPEELLDQPEHQNTTVRFPSSDMEEYDEYETVCRIVEKIQGRSYQRIASICHVLDIPTSSRLVKHAFICLRYLMRYRIDLFFDRHVDHFILSSLYGVAKQMKMEPEVKFTHIVDAYVAVRGPEMGDVTCQRIVHNIKLGGDPTGGSRWGHVIAFYNRIFVPAMKDHLMNSKSLQKAAAEAAQTIRFAMPSAKQKL